MEAILTNSELDALSKKVSELIYVKITHESFKETLEKESEKYMKTLIEFYISENQINANLYQALKPIIDNHIKTNNIVEQQLKEFYNTDNFKRLELNHLKKRVSDLEYELYHNHEDETN